MDVLGETPANFGTICAVLVPTYIFLFHDTIFPNSPSRFYVALRRCLTVLVWLHTLYTLRLLLSPPINLFDLLDLPLTAPPQALRVALLKHQKDRFPVGFQNNLLPHVETLLARLASFEARVTYIKFGPYALSKCEPCAYASDFIVYTVAPTVLPYLRALILVSLITSAPTFRTAWRTPALFVLVAMFFTEVWWTFDMKVQFQDERAQGWTHVHTYLARYTVLLLLPFILHILPAHSAPSALPPFVTVAPTRPTLPHQSSDFNIQAQGQASANGVPSTPRRANPSPSVLTSPPANAARVQVPSTPLSVLNGAISSLGTTLGALHVLEFARMAGLRRRELRERITDYFATADNNSLYARSDPQVAEEAEKLGMGYSVQVKDRHRLGKGKVAEDRVSEPATTPSQPNHRSGDEAQDADESSDEEMLSQQSPLRVRARQKAREIANVYLRRATPGPNTSGGDGHGSESG